MASNADNNGTYGSHYLLYIYNNQHNTAVSTVMKTIQIQQCFSIGVPQVAAMGSAETDRNCMGRNSQPQF